MPDPSRSDPWGLTVRSTGDVPLAPGPDSITPEFIDDGVPISWEDASRRVEKLVAGSTYEDSRFRKQWARSTRARLLSTDETIRARRSCRSTALVTTVVDPRLGEDSLIPPATALEYLLSTRPARRSALRRLLDADRWRAIRCVCPHRSGYAHEHTLVYSDGDLCERKIRNTVLRAHVDNCAVASESDHGDGAVSIETDPITEGPTRGIRYVAKQVPTMGAFLDRESDGRLGESSSLLRDADPGATRLAAVLEATGSPAFSILGESSG